jgi:capsid protein
MPPSHELRGGTSPLSISRHPVQVDGSVDARRTRLSIDRDRVVARQYYRHSPLARAVVQRTIDASVYDGPICASRSKDEPYADRFQELWETWWNSLGGGVALDVALDPEAPLADRVGGMDAAGLLGGPEALAALVVAFNLDGDALWLPVSPMAKAGGGAVQIIEAERVGHAGVDTDTLIDGVELDDVGYARAYHLRDWSYGGLLLSNQTRRIDARKSGAMLVRSMSDALANARRGVPALAPAAVLLGRLDEYHRSVLSASLVAACQSLVLTSPDPAAVVESLEQVGQADFSAVTGAARQEKRRELELDAGAILNLKSGSTAFQFKPEHPTVTHREFVETSIMMAFADQPVPLFALLLDARMVNLSSARSMFNYLDRYNQRLRVMIDRAVIRPLMRMKAQHWAAIGLLTGSAGIPSDWDRFETTWSPAPSSDLLSDLKAMQLAVDARFLPVSKAVERIFGEAWHPEQIGADLQLLRDNNVPVTVMPGSLAPGEVANTASGPDSGPDSGPASGPAPDSAPDSAPDPD